MIISELIKKLQYELDNTGDSEVYISIDISNKNKLEKHGNVISTKNLVTSLDGVDDGIFEFGIRNWMM